MGYIIPLAIVILDVLLIIKIARSDEPAKLPWILLIVFVPFLGPLIYIGVRTRGEPVWGRKRGVR